MNQPASQSLFFDFVVIGSSHCPVAKMPTAKCPQKLSAFASLHEVITWQPAASYANRKGWKWIYARIGIMIESPKLNDKSGDHR